MKDKELNKIAAIEKAIAKKYGKEAIKILEEIGMKKKKKTTLNK